MSYSIQPVVQEKFLPLTKTTSTPQWNKGHLAISSLWGSSYSWCFINDVKADIEIYYYTLSYFISHFTTMMIAPWDLSTRRNVQPSLRCTILSRDPVSLHQVQGFQSQDNKQSLCKHHFWHEKFIQVHSWHLYSNLDTMIILENSGTNYLNNNHSRHHPPGLWIGIQPVNLCIWFIPSKSCYPTL